jgi:CRISPR system Cascade subunit CasB
MSERLSKASSRAFVRRLEQLDPGDRARLKRHAGQPLSQATDVLGLFYGLLPRGVSLAAEDAYFLVATLFPLADGGGYGDLGNALRRATDSNNEKGLRRRLETLLDAQEAQLPFRLRQTVHFLHSKRVTIDLAALLDDLLYWSLPDRSVQRRWARSYFGVQPQPENSEDSENSQKKEALPC